MDDPNGIREVGCVFEADTFSSLVEIGLIVHSLDASLTLLRRLRGSSCDLTYLWIRFAGCIREMDGPSVQSFFDGVGMSLPRLVSLTVRFSHGEPLRSTSDITPLHFADIEGFLCIPSLTSFAIDHHRAIVFHGEDIIRLAQNAGRFRFLWLNPYPCHRTDVPRLDLGCIEYFARYCPLLERLALHVNGDWLPIDVDNVRIPPRFRRLRELYLGWSFIPLRWHDPLFFRKWRHIAVYLSHSLLHYTFLTSVLDYSDVAGMHVVAGAMRHSSALGYTASKRALDLLMAWRIVSAMARHLQVSRGVSTR